MHVVAHCTFYTNIHARIHSTKTDAELRPIVLHMPVYILSTHIRITYALWLFFLSQFTHTHQKKSVQHETNSRRWMTVSRFYVAPLLNVYVY